MSDIKMNLKVLLSNNQQYAQAFGSSPLMTLIQSPSMNDPKHRKRLLDCIQVFSNYFQKTVMLRSILNSHALFDDIIQQHLQEEFGHDVSLMHDRKERPPAWDPILDACSCWFTWKMLTSDDFEKNILIHLVLETSAHIFFTQAHKVMEKHAETDYFKIHAQADEHHETMGLKLLEGLRDLDYQHLAKIQSQGWDVLNAVCNRITELSSVTD